MIMSEIDIIANAVVMDGSNLLKTHSLGKISYVLQGLRKCWRKQFRKHRICSRDLTYRLSSIIIIPGW
jgi:hypothetical protein